MSPATERMSFVDTAWLRMDNEVNLMLIVGVWLLTPAVGLEALRERVAARLLRYGRFRQKVERGAMGATWVEDEEFDIARHVLAESLPRRRGRSARQALQQRCAELAAVRLDPARPLWQFHLVEDYEGGSALICRLHHCIADGIALLSVMQSITDDGALPPKRLRRGGAQAGAGAAPAQPQGLTEEWLALLAELAGRAGKLTDGGLDNSMDLLAHCGVQLLKDAAALAFMPDDSPTGLKGRPEGRKRVAWNEPLPLLLVRSVGKALNCSINDVLLSCVAGAVGAYLRDRGEETAGKEIRVMVPVNLRSPPPLGPAAPQLGNRFGLAPLVLPIGIHNPIERVYAVRERMAELKGSFQPALAFGILAVAGLAIPMVQDMITGLFARKTTAVMTNVPGPAEALSLCGSTLRQSIFWVPASGEVGVGISVLSYAGGVQFGLVTDRRLVPDPQDIVERFEPEFEKLLLVTLMLPWAGQDGGP